MSLKKIIPYYEKTTPIMEIYPRHHPFLFSTVDHNRRSWLTKTVDI